MRNIFVIICLLISVSISAQRFENRIYSPKIKTLQIYNSKKTTSFPSIELGSEERLVISFDEMEYSQQVFFYKIIHCDRHFRKSQLSEMEYYDGFTENQIYDIWLSENTLTNYTHYQFELSSEGFKVSGNYALLIAKDQDFSSPVAVALFYVSESMVDIYANVSGLSQKGFSTKYQQVDVEVDNSKIAVQNPMADFNLCVIQNRREDNMVCDLKPSFPATYKQQYSNMKELSFEGGNEYRFVDFADEYSYSGQIDRIDIKSEYYSVFTIAAEPRNMMFEPTGYGNALGRFIVNRKRYPVRDYMADYMWVNFILPADLDYMQYDIYILGDMFSNRLDEDSKMEYLQEENIYYKSAFLKQGGYSYLYAFVPKTNSVKQANLSQFEGSYWQTDNEYTILMYYTPWGSRYDRLVGVKTVK